MQLREQLNSVMSREGISVREMARRLGVSRTTLSRYIQGDEIESVERALVEYFSQNGKADLFIETRTVRIIWEILESCYREAEIGVVMGQAGVGKTTALTEWVNRNPYKAVMVTVTVTHTGRELISEIAEKLGLFPRGNTHRILQEVCGVLKDDRRVVIVDEADLLNERSLEILRAVHDLAGTGVVLSGMLRLFIKMTKGTDMMQNLAQLYSRVGYKVFIRGMTEDDIEMIIGAYQVSLDLREELLKIGQKTGMRGVIKAIKRARKLAALNNREVDRRILQKAATVLLMGLEELGI